MSVGMRVLKTLLSVSKRRSCNTSEGSSCSWMPSKRKRMKPKVRGDIENYIIGSMGFNMSRFNGWEMRALLEAAEAFKIDAPAMVLKELDKIPDAVVDAYMEAKWKYGGLIGYNSKKDIDNAIAQAKLSYKERGGHLAYLDEPRPSMT
jgi:hypothetical protein